MSPKALHLKLAYSLGRTAKKVSKTVSKIKKPSKAVKGTKAGKKSNAKEAKEPLSPILKEIKAILDVSGLTDALQEINEIGLKHSNHPLISSLVERVQELSPQEKEKLSMKFIERLSTNDCFTGLMHTAGIRPQMTDETCQQISDAFIESILYALEDVGMTTRQKDFLRKFSNEMTQPINELVQLYVNPKTFSQKVKRLWRMQRIFVKMIKLMHLANSLSKENDFLQPHLILPKSF